MRCWQSRGSQDRIRHLWLLRPHHGHKLPLRSSSMYLSRTTRADTFGFDVGGFQGSHTWASRVDHQKNQGRGVGCETEAKPRLRVNRSPIAYPDVQDREKGCGHDRRLGKCSGRFRKYPHMIRVRKVLENPRHTPAAESFESC